MLRLGDRRLCQGFQGGGRLRGGWLAVTIDADAVELLIQVGIEIFQVGVGVAVVEMVMVVDPDADFRLAASSRREAW